MAEPLSALAALGVATSIITLIDVSSKVLRNATIYLHSNALPQQTQLKELWSQWNVIIGDLGTAYMHQPGRSGTPEFGQVEETHFLSQAGQVTTDASHHATGDPQPIHVKAVQNLHSETGRMLKLLKDLEADESLKGARRAINAIRQARRAHKNDSKLQEHQKHLKDLIDQLAVATLTEMAKNQSTLLSNVPDVVGEGLATAIAAIRKGQHNAKKTKDFLETLGFADMSSRRDSIVKAHQHTFDWAFEGTGLRHWLERGEGIYWICGKAGSRKLTLMKSLIDNTNTWHMACSWSKQDVLVIAEFFFWYLGSSEQKSVRGLLRGILYQILQSQPRLIEKCCPQRWVDLESASPRMCSWTEEELLSVLDIIAEPGYLRLAGSTTSSSAKFVFFIDGLDEFDGNHRALVALLRKLLSSGDVKICTSSRPWNVFENAFEGSDALLRLEEWTREDIKHFARDELTEAECAQQNRNLFADRAPQAEALVTSIAEKAQGVFLWVFLVVRSLIDGFENGDNIAMMQRRLDDFPSELQDYFSLILSRMDRVYQSMTAQALVLAGLPVRQNAMLREITFLDIYPMVEDPAHYENERFAFDRAIAPYPIQDHETMVRKTAYFIRATCRDFLHMPYDWSQVPLSVRSRRPADFAMKNKVEFLHRTVHDFLEVPEVRQLFAEHLPEHFLGVQLENHIALVRARSALANSTQEVCLRFEDIAGSLLASKHTGKEIILELDNIEASHIRRSCSNACPLHGACIVDKSPAQRRATKRHCVYMDQGAYEAMIATYFTRSADPWAANLSMKRPSSSVLRAAFGMSSSSRQDSPRHDLRKIASLLVDAGVDPQYLANIAEEIWGIELSSVVFGAAF
ncbi:hypothetical protein Q7P36_011271 [Cladosporium allicinum]